MSITFDIGSMSGSSSRSPRPVTLFVALDTSEEMGATHQKHSLSKKKTNLELASKSAFKMLDTLSGKDRAFVVAFGSEVDVLSDNVVKMTDSNKEEIKKKMIALKPKGSAKLYDIIVASVKGVLASAAAQQEESGSGRLELWLAILTAGEDTTSAAPLAGVVKLVEDVKRSLGSDIMNIVIIGLDLNERAKNNVLKIKEAGGKMVDFIDAKNTKDVSDAFDGVSDRVLKCRTATPKPDSNEKEEEDEPDWEGDIQRGSHVRCVGSSFGAVQSVVIGDVGVVQKKDKDGDFIVDFPRKDGWIGRPTDLVVDEISEKVRPGSLVVVRASVTEPVCGWGSIQRSMHGMVREVKHDGAVKIQFGLLPDSKPSEGLWTSQLKELEVVDPGDFCGSFAGKWPGKLQLGMAVRVPSRLSAPSTGWGNLKPGEIGYVRAFKPTTKSYVCDFPSIDGWQGREADLEMERIATLVRPGKQVRVRENVEPSLGWHGVTRESVGVVLSCSYDAKTVVVRFPEHKNWKGRLSELETLDRPPTPRAVAANGAIDCPEYHGLTEITTIDLDQKQCDFCGADSGPPGTLMYTCTRCDIDACVTCYNSRPRTVVASPTPSVASSNDVPFATAVTPDTSVESISSVSPAYSDPEKTEKDTKKLILIKGLTSPAGMKFNGKLGEIMDGGDEQTELHMIKIISEEEEKVFKLKDDKFEAAEGRLVALCNMDDSKLDGKVGQIVGYNVASGLISVGIKGRIMALAAQKINILPEPDELT